MEIAGIYTEFQRSLLTYVRTKIRSKEDAEDILQNVFAKISANADSLSEKEKIQNWLFTVTKNAVIDYYRTNAKRRTLNSANPFLNNCWKKKARIQPRV
ncbi:MAG: hypothetical protein IPK96_04235 [Flammeovirgaceae bacterium]|nr:hypothetical protein [Flammeovirgaceae bacterium]